jgi:NAD+ synthase (glutamine-hydrolysing)
MTTISLAAVSLSTFPLDLAGNAARIGAALDEARARGASVVLLPELCVTGYGCEDAFSGVWLAQAAWRTVVDTIAPRTRGLVVAVGLPVWTHGAMFNAAVLLVDGVAVGLAAKGDLAGDSLFYEPRWFKPWPRGQTSHVVLGDARLPIGDLCFDVGGVRFAFEICEEAWVAGRVSAQHARHGVDVVLNPSASPFALHKDAVRDRFVLEGSRATASAYLLANLVGNEAGRLIFEGGSRIAAGGAMRARGERLGFVDHDVVVAQVDLDALRSQRAASASFRVDVSEEAVVSFPFVWPSVDLAPSPALDPQPAPSPEDDFARAVALGLFDHARRSGSRGWVVSLSGGADSAVCATLAAAAVRLAVQARGLAATAEALRLPAPSTPEALVRAALTTVYQATRNSGSVTETAAAKVAEGLNATHHRWSVDDLVDGATARVEAALGRALRWETDDVTLQNIQARARAPGVWMLANAEGKLLLATSNRSEAAVGYATMDGDTAGGLSPIAGIDKAFLRRWLRHAETHGIPGLGAVPSLAWVNAQQPTAELRPASAHQTDETDLMPYDVLDAIERQLVRDHATPLAIWRGLVASFPQHDPKTLGTWVRRFLSLWTRNQWKRERYAPAFHLDAHNLDPRSACRFPILSAGFVEGLEAMDAAIEG